MSTRLRNRFNFKEKREGDSPIIEKAIKFLEKEKEQIGDVFAMNPEEFHLKVNHFIFQEVINDNLKNNSSDFWKNLKYMLDRGIISPLISIKMLSFVTDCEGINKDFENKVEGYMANTLEPLQKIRQSQYD